MERPSVSIYPLTHRGEERIKIECPFDREVISKIRQVEGSQWSKTNQCWHVPYTGPAFRRLKELFAVTIPPEVAGKKQQQETLPEFAAVAALEPEAPAKNPQAGIQPSFKIILNNGIESKVVTGEHLVVLPFDEKWLTAYIPYDKKNWLEKIKAIRGRKWEPERKCWKIPYSKESL
jgi:hypothetical protein